jgi:hypothetical protein
MSAFSEVKSTSPMHCSLVAYGKLSREEREFMNLGKIFLGAYEENQRGELVSRIRQEHPDLLALRFSDFRVCGERA